ncbi:RNA-binding domain-containing protein [Xylaria cf. heliscus]|nr:RNA-binding domain-containing protein [Xylaria cf. heliscus]
MHCVRRAALRAACASSRFVAVPRQQVAANAMQISKANLRPTAVLPLSRYFSQTTPAAQEEREDGEAIDNAIHEAEQGGSTFGDNEPLTSSLSDNKSAIQSEAYTIFIANMTFDATDVHLQEAFSKYGDIISLNIVRDGRGLSRGFGFITFAKRESADRAIREAHDSFWHGRRIRVAYRDEGTTGRTRGRANMGPTRALYIGNIPYEASDADLNQLFRRLENVDDVRVAVDRSTGWPRGFAHADFHDVESAQKAFEMLSQETLNGRQLRVDFAEPRPRRGNEQGE